MPHPQVLPLFDSTGKPLTGAERDRARKRYWAIHSRDKYIAMRRREYRSHRDSILAKQKEARDKSPLMRERARLRAADWYKNNPERIAARHSKLPESKRIAARIRAKEWSRANPEKAAAHRKLIKARRKSRLQNVCPNPLEVLCFYTSEKASPTLHCFYCGTSLVGKPMHMDHIQPLVKSGMHTAANLAASCPKCNLTKNEHDLTDWFGNRPLFYEI